MGGGSNQQEGDFLYFQKVSVAAERLRVFCDRQCYTSLQDIVDDVSVVGGFFSQRAKEVRQSLSGSFNQSQISGMQLKIIKDTVEAFQTPYFQSVIETQSDHVGMSEAERVFVVNQMNSFLDSKDFDVSVQFSLKQARSYTEVQFSRPCLNTINLKA